MHLNRASPIPLYLQLAEIITIKIDNREYPPGSRLPSEAELAQFFSLGRPTVRQALHRLEEEGRLRRRKGAGTFVAEKPPEVDLFSLAGTSSAFFEKDIALSQRLQKKIGLVTVKPDPVNPFAGQRAYFFSRLSLYRGESVLLEETYLDPIFFRGIEQFDFAAQSLSRIVKERFYAVPVSFRQTFRVVPDRARPPVFGASKSPPLLQVARTIYFPGLPAGIFSYLYCRTDRFTFSQELGGANDS